MKFIRGLVRSWPVRWFAPCFACLFAGTAFGHGPETVAVNIELGSDGNLHIANAGTGTPPYTDHLGNRLYADHTDRLINISPLAETVVPGVVLAPTLLSSDVELGWRILDPELVRPGEGLDKLIFWTPDGGLNGDGGFADSDVALTMEPVFDEWDFAQVTNADIVKPEFRFWNSSVEDGNNHHLVNYSLPFRASVGAYGVYLQAVDLREGSPYGPSEPFLIILNQGLSNASLQALPTPGQPLDNSEFGRAVAAIANSVETKVPPLQAGDANQDLAFDQQDVIQVLVSARYLSGEPATWGDGDWNGAPGGTRGNPPQGDGLFNQFDIVAAQQAGVYLTGTYAALQPNGQSSDGKTSIAYNARSGELGFQTPAGTERTSIVEIDSAAAIFTEDAAMNLGGSFDNDADINIIFKATLGSHFSSLTFGNMAQTGLASDFVLNDPTMIGSLAGRGEIGNVDVIYVPEPTAIFLMVFGFSAFIVGGRRRLVSDYEG